MKILSYDSIYEYITDFRHTLDRLTQVLDKGNKLLQYMLALLFVEGLASKYSI
jgi:hypothetical protein